MTSPSNNEKPEKKLGLMLISRALYLPTAARHCRGNIAQNPKNFVAFLTVIICLHASPAPAVSIISSEK